MPDDGERDEKFFAALRHREPNDRFYADMATDPPGKLSERETQVLILRSFGLTSEMIGKELFLSPNTIKTHLASARRKLRAKDTTHAVAIAMRTGLIE